MAAKLASAQLSIVPISGRLKLEAEELEKELQEKRTEAQELQAKASGDKSNKPYLQLRARVRRPFSFFPKNPQSAKSSSRETKMFSDRLG